MCSFIEIMKLRIRYLPLLITLLMLVLLNGCKKEEDPIVIKEYDLKIDPGIQFQTIEGFGASLAFYEGWLTAHPKKKEIYNAIFKELSLDILRVRNAFDYDAGMIDRVSEFAQEAEASLGKPIKILSTSWGPPAYLKSNHDRTKGGTIKYSISNSQVLFDYIGFANWWEGALNEYNSHGVYPAYIGIQNEPDFTASYESCRFDPVEKITSSDTIAGYNLALEAVYNMINQRTVKPKLLGPESVGCGYNIVQNYINALNTSYLYGIAHHLYHGVNVDDPWSSTDIPKVGALHPEIPHFQTEYSLGDWFSLAGLIYKSLNDENAVAYLYWELIWDGGGLVSLDFPWDQSRWSNSNGYARTKDFYVFKQFSAFIHPGWKRISTSPDNYFIKTLAFTNSAKDSAALVLINRSSTEQYQTNITMSGINFTKASYYRTSAIDDCALINNPKNSEVLLPPKSITTVVMSLLK
jgi:glucuronoarabinoxylan endo-1,4-beta-xylanase